MYKNTKTKNVLDEKQSIDILQQKLNFKKMWTEY